ncbi:hypothetical protein [Changchengzhania lutea]|uniref:hypothetical protein n=1 Tax=Changchengzhania lutea TaxID=2049305 RepID=UPI00115EB730|nr:hypothetical protein [Changchengzhania lutea]
MAPIKFEEHIKDQLEKRSLQPTTDAWDKLSERLEHQEKTQNKKPYWWLGLAASVVGALFVVSQFINQKEAQEDTPKVVVSPQIISSDVVAENEKETVDKTLNESKASQPNDKILKNSISEKTTPLAKVEVVNETNRRAETSINKSLDLLPKPLNLESQKIKGLVAQVQILETNNIAVTDEAIEALLREAEADIKRNRLLTKSESIVDANALLQDVEDDLERSFRSKVFEAIKASYKSVKTAVAQRND